MFHLLSGSFSPFAKRAGLLPSVVLWLRLVVNPQQCTSRRTSVLRVQSEDRLRKVSILMFVVVIAGKKEEKKATSIIFNNPKPPSVMN